MFGHNHHNGTMYNTESSYYNYNSATGAEICSSNHPATPQVQTHYPNTGYHYEEPATSSSSYVYTDSLDAPASPQGINYYHHQDNSIINTETGLSYTNLDYANSNGTLYPISHVYPTTEPNFPTLRHPEETENQINYSIHDNKYNIPTGHHLDVTSSGETNFHHHLVTGGNGQTPPSSCMEYQQHLQRYKEEGSSSDGRLRPHHLIHHGLNSLPQNQPTLPTYKWMQVKRNVPKPAGK